MARYYNPPARGAVAWPPDAYYDPCSTGHSEDVYRDSNGRWCCRRCGEQVVRP